MLEGFPPAFADGWADFEEEAGPVLVEEMAVQSPVATGQLADSHSWTDNEGVLQVVSTDNRGPVAMYVLRGTAPHPIDPVYARALHWVDVNGADVFAGHVDHPGTAPNRYNLRAWETVGPQVVGLFAQRVGLRYALAFLNPWTRQPL